MYLPGVKQDLQGFSAFPLSLLSKNKTRKAKDVISTVKAVMRWQKLWETDQGSTDVFFDAVCSAMGVPYGISLNPSLAMERGRMSPP